MKEAEPQDINDCAFMMYAKREETDGITNIAYRVHSKLPVGEYRIGIPFSYIYYIQGRQVDYINQKLKENNLQPEDGDLYYSTRWGEPAFYFNGQGVMSTTEVQRTTDYTVYGTFTVE